MDNSVKEKLPKYVANGTYGCVFKPAISCADNEDISNKISKVFNEELSGQDELYIYQSIINKLDPRHIFTVNIHNSCKISKHKIPSNEISKCTNFQDNKNSVLYQIIYEYGGITLSEVILIKSFDNIFQNMGAIFKGICVFKKKKYIHNDIKPDNIVYNLETKKMAFIDFGLLYSFDDIYSYDNIDILSTSNYHYYPPEYSVFSEYLETNLVNIDYLSLYTKNIKVFHIRCLQPLINKTIELFKTNNKNKNEFLNALISLKHAGNDDFIDFINQVTNKTDIYLYFKENTHKIDIYMIGITLIELLNIRFKKEFNNIKKHIQFYVSILKLVHEMIYMDPRKRITPENAYKTYKKILKMKNNNI